MEENLNPRRPTPSAADLFDADLFDADLFDAGDMGCGELVLKLKLRMVQLKPGQVLHLISLDSGAVEDIPVWCQMTQHRLILAQHPDYWIERKAT